MLNKLKEIFREVAGLADYEEIDENKHFKDFGLDPYDKTEFTVRVEVEFNVDINEKEFDSISTIKDVLNLLSKS